MNLTNKKNTRVLEEFGLANLGRFIRFEVIQNEYAKVVFENETLIIGTEEDEHSQGELVSVVDSKPTNESTTATDLELADFEMYTGGVSLVLTNGDHYGLDISCNYDEFDDESKIPWDLDKDYTVRFIQPTI